MMNINLRIELSGLDKARTELNALLTLIDTLEGTYPVAEKAKPEPKVAPKPTPSKPKPTPKAKKTVTPKPTPVKEEKTVKTASSVTEADILALARETGVRLGAKEAVKDTISKYGSKISAVKPEDYEALSADLKAL